MKKLVYGFVAALTLGAALFVSTLSAQTCTSTTNLGLCKGARGATEWDTFLNTNFDLIDANVVNTGSGTQTKSGILVLGGLRLTGLASGPVLLGGASSGVTTDPSYFFWDAVNHRLGIGTASPSSALDVNGTVTLTGFKYVSGAGAGKVLTSDGSGNATWQTVGGASTGWELVGSVSRLAGSYTVGLGVASPTEKIEVAGGIKLGAALATQAGTIQWDGSHFQGYDGASWINLDYTAAAAGGWTDAGTNVHLTTATDCVQFGGTVACAAKGAVYPAVGETGFLISYGTALTDAAKFGFDLTIPLNVGTSTPTLMRVNASGTSGANTLFLNFLWGGSSVFSVNKAGTITSSAGASFGADVAITGQVSSTTFQMATGAVAGYVLTTDGSGNGTWQVSAAGSGVPTGMIALFDAACPVGWTSISGVGEVLNGRFPYGGAAYSATPGGASSHSHDVNPASTTSSAVSALHTHTISGYSAVTAQCSGCAQDSTATGTESVSERSHTHSVTLPTMTTSSSGAHTHTVDIANTTSTSASTLPPYVTFVYCKKS